MSKLFFGRWPLATNYQTTVVRPIVETDVHSILRMVDMAWRVHLRVGPIGLGTKIKTLPGILAEDRVGLRGFMLIEPQYPNIALIIAAGLRDTWGVKPYLDLLLPDIERVARSKKLLALAHIGHEAWLIKGLQDRGFEAHEWILSYERIGAEPPPATPKSAFLRTAHRNDLPTILKLDALAFDHLWRKSVTNFSEALARAASFLVAEVDGQIVGYAWCDVYQQHAHLTRLGVHPDFQGYGIGAQLLHETITHMLASGVNLITLNTQENNHRSRALYQRFGFVNTQHRMPVLWKDLE